MADIPSSSHSRNGFALPSVLMLVTVLSLVALSVIALKYFEREMVLRDVARLKAEYAAQSGIACAMDVIEERGVDVEFDSTFIFTDSSRAGVHVVQWGVSSLIESKGEYHRSHSDRRAVVGMIPGKAFDFALVVGNKEHQLIMTGDASVKGDVAVGPPGVSTGTLSGHSTPNSVKIKGSILRSGDTLFPIIPLNTIERLATYYQGFCFGTQHLPGLNLRWDADSTTFQTQLPDTVVSITVPAGFILKDSISSLHRRMYIRCPGILVVASTARINGLVTILSTDSIAIQPGAALSGTVLVALHAISTRGNLASTQLLAPWIAIDTLSRGTYPTTAFSLPLDTASYKQQSLSIQKGANVQGFFGLWSPRGDDLLATDPPSSVEGTLYSNAHMTQDGTLKGSALTYDLFFYEAPSSYIGWLREGSINRRRLADGLLVPPLFKGTLHLGVLEWR